MENYFLLVFSCFVYNLTDCLNENLFQSSCQIFFLFLFCFGQIFCVYQKCHCPHRVITNQHVPLKQHFVNSYYNCYFNIAIRTTWWKVLTTVHFTSSLNIQIPRPINICHYGSGICCHYGVHIATGHGRDRMVKELGKKYANLTRDSIELCIDCQRKRVRPMTKVVVVRTILSKEFPARGQVVLFNMQSLSHCSFKWIMMQQDHLTKSLLSTYWH